MTILLCIIYGIIESLKCNMKEVIGLRDKMLIDIYIMEILINHSSLSNRLHQQDIINYLDKEYNLNVCRNTLAGYIGELREQGYIAGERGIYCIRKFTNIEIKILINSIMYTKAIPADDIKKISDKLNDMLEPEERNRLKSTYFINNTNHTDNKKVCEIVETIDRAIEKRKKIEITTCRYDIRGKLIDKGKRIVNPYYIILEKSRYYLICYSGRDDIEPRRIDRISDVKVLNEKRLEINQIEKYKTNSFSIDKYIKESVYMYSGSNERVTLKIKKDNIGDFIDWYGKEYSIVNIEDENVTVAIRANVNAVYFWALQYGRIAEVIRPTALREMIRNGLQEMLLKYEKKT